jgi:hypothetical protein
MKTVAALCLLVVAAAFPLTAQEFQLEYLEGTLEMQDGGTWVELFIGDSVPQGSVIRLGDNGFAQLSAGGVTVNLGEDGSYDTDALLRSGQKVAGWNLGSLVNSKLSKLISPASSGETAAMGVRGADQQPNDLIWMDGSEDLETGKNLLAEGRLDEAIGLLEDGAELAATSREAQEFLFYTAYAHALKGESALALITLEDMEPGSDAPFFTDYVLLKGKLLIDSLAFDDALALFAQYLQHPDMGETTQVVHYLSAVCYQGLDRLLLARQSLDAAYRIEPDSEYGRAAREMRAKL